MQNYTKSLAFQWIIFNHSCMALQNKYYFCDCLLNTTTMIDYDQMVAEARDELFACVEKRGLSNAEIDLVHRSYALAEEAHRPQRRKSGEPYILHPIAVAMIVANEIGLGAEPICAALLHDVVEDTDHTVKEIREMFGDDVATLVNVVTKKKKSTMKPLFRSTTTSRCSNLFTTTYVHCLSNWPTACTICAPSSRCSPTSN